MTSLRTGNEIQYEEVYWQTDEYRAGVSSKEGESLHFWLTSGDSQTGFSVESKLKTGGAADRVLKDAKVQAQKVLKKHAGQNCTRA